LVGLEVLAALATFRPRAVPWARRALFGLGVLACVLGFPLGPGVVLPGIAAIVASRLLRRTPVRGVD
jgi:hypothetical protein